MCSVTTPETIAPAPKPTPTIWMVFSKERSRSACSISTMPPIEDMVGCVMPLSYAPSLIFRALGLMSITHPTRLKLVLTKYHSPTAQKAAQKTACLNGCCSG